MNHTIRISGMLVLCVLGGCGSTSPPEPLAVGQVVRLVPDGNGTVVRPDDDRDDAYVQFQGMERVPVGTTARIVRNEPGDERVTIVILNGPKEGLRCRVIPELLEPITSR